MSVPSLQDAIMIGLGFVPGVWLGWQARKHYRLALKKAVRKS